MLLLNINIAVFFNLSHAYAQTPGEAIVSTIARGLNILQDPQYQGMDNYFIRRQKLWEAVSPVFNFTETSKRAMGRHWLNLSHEQKKTFTDTFTKILKNVYLNKSDSYRGEKIVYVREIVRGKRAKVQTNFFTTSHKKITIDFSML